MNVLPLKDGELFHGPTPVPFGPHSYPAIHRCGAVGPITIHGTSPSGPSNFFRLNDGGSDLLFDGVEFTALWRCWVTAAERATFRKCHFHHNRMEGIILGACVGAVLEDCIAEFCGPAYLGGYADSNHREPSAAHAFYAQNYGGKQTTMRRCRGQHVSGCGLHLYGNGDTGDYGEAFTGEDLAFMYCGSEGTPTIQPTGTLDSSLTNLLIAFSAVGDFTWDRADGMPCKRWTIDRFTQWSPDARFVIHVAPGVAGLLYTNGIILVPSGKQLCEGDGGDFEYPSFRDCVIGTDRPGDLPSEVQRNNKVWDLNRLNALFPRALKGDFTPADPGVPGFRDWTAAPVAPPPSDPPPPPSDPPPPPVVVAPPLDRAALHAAVLNLQAGLTQQQSAVGALAKLLDG